MTIRMTTLLRILIYSILACVVFVVIVFVSNTTLVTSQTLKVVRAYQDIFKPIQFEDVKYFLQYQAQQRILTAHPKGSAEIISVKSDGEMMFIVTYNVIEDDGLREHHREYIYINWKPYLYD